MRYPFAEAAAAVFVIAVSAACETSSPSVSPATDDVAYAEADRRAVEQLIQGAFDEVWSGTDTAAVRRFHTDDFVILEHGEVWTTDTIRNWQLGTPAGRRPDAPQRRNSFTFFRNEAAGEDAWVAYHNRAHWVDAGGDTVGAAGWLESAVATRTEQGWKLRMMHSTRLALSPQ